MEVTTYATAISGPDNYFRDGYPMFVPTEKGYSYIAELEPASRGRVGIAHLL